MTRTAAPLPPPPRSALVAAWLALSAVATPLGERLLRKRLAQGKEDPDRWQEKLGLPSLPRPDGRLVWVHAVSVGESLSILPLLNRLVAAGVQVLVTSTTVTSARLLSERLPAGCRHQFLPLDVAPAVAAFLDHWRPNAAVMVESEFWPRLICETHARGIPLVLANARMSDRSARRWRMLRGPIRAMLARFTALTAPDPRVASLLAELGADPRRITVTASLKRGADRLPVAGAELNRMRDSIGNRPRWLAASTHPGEEEVVLEAHARLLADAPDSLLVLAPRHPDRGDAIMALIAATGLAVARRTSDDPIRPETQVYLADTLGELGLWFDLCGTAFIGGSLVPVGGHNAYEPVTHGAAVLTGPQTGNFALLYERLVASGGARIVQNAPELAQAVRDLADRQRHRAQTDAATATVAGEDDATDSTAAIILSAMGGGAVGAI